MRAAEQRAEQGKDYSSLRIVHAEIRDLAADCADCAGKFSVAFKSCCIAAIAIARCGHPRDCHVQYGEKRNGSCLLVFINQDKCEISK
ncbi:hypothetical protein [Aquisediminimonas sediminicola]|uniref:hypothetical protein n=1 Tax=Alteraquisediminimonas sediminicola TaxID=2676787 RepID=UPI001C8D6A9F|nr:hypothetical protein [Aquisediminimonas sediminicola]